MAQLTVYAKTGITNWDDSNGWNSQSDGGGTDYTNPQNNSDTYICDLNGKAVVLNVDATVDRIQSSNANGYLTVTSTRVITGSNPANNIIQYSSTSTSGMVRVSNGSLTVSNGVCSNSSTGYIFVLTNSTLEVNNVGNTACVNSGGGRIAAFNSATSTMTVNGNCSNTSTGGVFWLTSGTINLNGNLSCSNTGQGALLYGGTFNFTGTLSATNGKGIRVDNGNLFITNSTLSSSIGIPAVSIEGGIANFIGNNTISAATDCFINLVSGTLNLATASSALNLSCSGRLNINRVAGTITTTAAGGTASIVLQDNNASASILGTATSIITMLNLSAGNIKNGVTIHGVVGTYTGSSTSAPRFGDKTGGLR